MRGGQMNVPGDLRYTTDHEWVRRDGDRFTIGITAFAQEALGDIVFVERPKADEVAAGDVCGEIESTKSVSELYAPLSGKVVASNEQVDEHPEVVNADPYGEGWIAVIESEDLGGFEALLSPAQYEEIIAASAEG
jgi:glycine cleavage system H protein